MANRTIIVQGNIGVDRIPHFAAIAAENQIRVANDLDSLRAALPGAEVLFGWDFKADDLESAWPAADRLEWIHWSGAGVDALLFAALANSPVRVTNARGIFDRAMAEYVLGLVLAHAKRLPETVRLQSERRWQHRLSQRIDSRRAVVIGAGSIGRSIARLLRAVGMRVDGVGRAARGGDAEFERIFGAEDLTSALSGADYVIAVLPGTAQTENFINAPVFAAMGPDTFFVNVGRGATVDEAALVAALESGRLAGAALDVFDSEPLAPHSPLWAHPGVIISPHMSGDFQGYDEALGWLFAQNYQRFEAGQPLLNEVNKARGY